jgi:hypothetical protein
MNTYKIEHATVRGDGKLVVILSDNILTYRHRAPKDEVTMTKIILSADELMERIINQQTKVLEGE